MSLEPKSDHSLIVRLGKTVIEAKGHGVYVIPVVLVLVVLLFSTAVGLGPG